MPAKRPKPIVKYHTDGTLWAQGQTVDGAMTGYWEWFRKTGTIMRSGSFINGEQTGTWTTYDSKGKVYKVTKMEPKAAKTKAKPKTRKKAARKKAR